MSGLVQWLRDHIQGAGALGISELISIAQRVRKAAEQTVLDDGALLSRDASSAPLALCAFPGANRVQQAMAYRAQFMPATVAKETLADQVRHASDLAYRSGERVI